MISYPLATYLGFGFPLHLLCLPFILCLSTTLNVILFKSYLTKIRGLKHITYFTSIGVTILPAPLGIEPDGVVVPNDLANSVPS
jgi:hypothetical protein